MSDETTTVQVSVDLALTPRAAFDVISEELALGLERLGLRLDPGADGRVSAGHLGIGRVTAWEPGRRIALEWRPAAWEPGEVTEVEVGFAPAGGGTHVTVEHRRWGRLVGESAELAGWFAGEVAAPLLRATAPAAFGDWLTDRRARRPTGAAARGVYGDPLFHYPGFRAILEELALAPDDYLLEVACGGGALLKDALQSGCRAAAVDHSPDMVRLAREANREAVEEGRLEVHEASADRLPFPDGTFTCVTMAGALGFLPDPVAALAEARRVLRPRGRFLCQGMDPELRDTPAAPEPMASRLRFYEDADLLALGRDAGFEEVEVVRRDLEPHARAVGIPEEVLPLYRLTTGGNRFLRARRH